MMKNMNTNKVNDSNARIFIFGAGYGGRKMPVFLSTLVENRVELLVDIRSIPISRHYPAFSKTNLISSLSSVGIQYAHDGRAIGGKLRNVGFSKKLDQLAQMANDGQRICVMCAESDPTQCHRTSKLKPALARRGIELIEIRFLD